MIITVDEALPFWEEAFTNVGKVRLFSGRSLEPGDIRDADALVVRTVTPVNASLLRGSSIRFVGAASAGTDHVDRDYLERNNVFFSYSAGCNADAVSEYVFTALYTVAAERHWDLRRKTLAVIGVGNVGSRVVRKARALGMEVLLCDPPLRESTGDPEYLSLDDVLGADILSFHVPLTSDGPYPTRHMLNKDILARLSPEQYVINASRGGVIDSPALKEALRRQRISGAILDVWEGEPEIDYSLLELADIGTPHIAGTSMDGKIRATEMVREELGRFFGVSASKITDSITIENVRLAPEPETAGQEAVLSVLRNVFDIRKADADLRALSSLPAREAAAGFDRLRKMFPLRPEFRHFVVELDGMEAGLTENFRGLGFQVRTARAN